MFLIQKKHLFNKNLSGLSPLCVPRKRAVPLFLTWINKYPDLCGNYFDQNEIVQIVLVDGLFVFIFITEVEFSHFTA